MYKIWKIMDPRSTLLAISVFLTLLGLTIHFGLLSTEDLDWHSDGRPAPLVERAAALRAEAGLPY
ncbi:Antenna complex alpha/beta subunit [Thioflavicoccus mobilis 8321]|uniref:Antenna complex alpha/beta subunit n=1 Tax=Thioflavicoccus mobilis 8321 TaxID=765912 RepID=L0GY40_9GAMM|nr:light-harvesting antenna LH1, alpha subunit [Thioflavicoccus mobilis]AGA91678.1 Antenna complex alpha/beta subunit [Thioflavicoccus mobilis 8321]